MEILKQTQYNPMPVEQEVIIVAVANMGLLDDVPVSRLTAFEGFPPRCHPPLFVLVFCGVGLPVPLALRHRAAEDLEVGEHELCIDHFSITHRVDVREDVCYIRLGEAADEMDDGVHLPDLAQKLIAEAFALAGALDQTSDVDETDRGRGGFLR